MFIEIESLKDEPLEFHHRYAEGGLAFEHEEASLVSPVTVDFVLTHKGSELSIHGSLETAVRMKCARCLKEFSKDLGESFGLLYAPHPKVTGPGAEIELKYDEMDVGFYDGIRFDVDLMIAERIAMALPMRSLCREDCKGLCFSCGKDLNEGPCRCESTPADSRMSVLLEFRKKTKD